MAQPKLPSQRVKQPGNSGGGRSGAGAELGKLERKVRELEEQLKHAGAKEPEPDADAADPEPKLGKEIEFLQKLVTMAKKEGRLESDPRLFLTLLFVYIVDGVAPGTLLREVSLAPKCF